jgi:cytoskeleton protein RodZ
MEEPAAATGNSDAPAHEAPAGEGAPAPTPAPPPVARSIGERLRAGRERSGLSIAAAAEKLHLDPKVIEALEADRFAEIGASVYVRGHLKRYADFVGEPGAELVSMYSTRESRADTPDLTQIPHPERRADPRRLVNPLVALGSAAVLLAAIWWVLSGSRSAAPVESTAQATPVVAGDAAPLTQPGTLTATPASLSASTPVETPAAPKPATAAPPAAAAPPATETAVKEAPAREIRLRLELTDESWVEVYDSRGERLYYDVASAGSVQSVSGRGPLRVVLENAAGVTVEVDGERREIPDGAMDGERARFVVNRSGSLSRAR